MTTDTFQEIAVSTWSIDPAHSSVHFKIRYLAIGWVHGEFRVSRGRLSWSESNIEESRIELEIDSSSVYTGEPKRDEHLRNADFLDVARFPSMLFRSTRISRLSAGLALVAGDLTIHGVCRPVTLEVSEISMPAKDASGNVILAASATTGVNREDFGITWNKALETGAVLIGDEILVDLDVEFMKKGGLTSHARPPADSDIRHLRSHAAGSEAGAGLPQHCRGSKLAGRTLCRHEGQSVAIGDSWSSDQLPNVENAMSLIDRALKANETYAKKYDRRLGDRPAPKVAVVTCMDPRLSDLTGILGLPQADLDVIRTGGPAVTEDVLGELVVSTRILGSKEIMLLNHTGCGFTTFTDDELNAKLAASTGDASPAPMRFFSFKDPEENTREQINRVRSHPWIDKEIPVRGFIFDVETGVIREVHQAAHNVAA